MNVSDNKTFRLAVNVLNIRVNNERIGQRVLFTLNHLLLYVRSRLKVHWKRLFRDGRNYSLVRSSTRRPCRVICLPAERTA